jgi:hypothetical protein
MRTAGSGRGSLIVPPNRQMLQRLTAHLDARLDRGEGTELRWWIGGQGWVAIEERWGVLWARLSVRSGAGTAVALTSMTAVRAFLKSVVFARRDAATWSALKLGSHVM